MKKWMIVPVLLMILGSMLSACSMLQATPKAQTAAPAAAAAQQQPTVAPVKAGDRIVSEGSVVPAQYAYLSFPSQGIIGEVLIPEGQAVQSGQVIARLKGSARLQASVTAAEVALLQAQQALDDLNKNADVARANVQLEMAQAAKDLDKAKEDRDSKAYTRGDQSMIDKTQAQLLLAQDAYDKVNETWQYFKSKDQNNIDRAAVLTQLSQAQQNLDTAKANYNYVTGKPDQFDVGLVDAKLAVAKAKYDQTLRDWELVKNGPNPDDMALAQGRLDDAKSQLDAAKAALSDQELTAPFNGTLVNSDLKVGQFVGPGTGTVTLADLSNYQVKTTDLTELSVVGIQEGTPVSVSFDAIPGLDLPGKVIAIKSLGEDKQGDVTYTVTVQLDNQDERLRWNMTSSVVFQTK